MPQPTETSEATYHARIETLKDAMKEFGLQAVVLEPGSAMVYYTGVRWGRSERTFAAVVTLKGEPAFVLPGFEEMRARELIRTGAEIRIWQEDDSPYQQIARILTDRGVTTGRVGIDASARFFVFDGLRKLAPKLEYVSAQAVLVKIRRPGLPPQIDPRPRSRFAQLADRSLQSELCASTVTNWLIRQE